ncbi:unnamed protein product [Parajaminaea phylloscopi]
MSSQGGPRVLSNREEDQLRKDIKAQGLKKCDDVVRKFAECSTGRTVSVAWACRGEHRAVQQCLAQHTSPEALERARKQWLIENRP